LVVAAGAGFAGAGFAAGVVFAGVCAANAPQNNTDINRNPNFFISKNN
jgi:hypothetical protein